MTENEAEIRFKSLSLGSPSETDSELVTARERAAADREYGRSVEPEVPQLERAVAERGADVLGVVLMERNRRRWSAVQEQIGLPGSFVLPRLARLASIDAGLSALGLRYRTDGSPEDSPANVIGDWAHHLRWGADSVAAAGRFLMLYQAIGAVALLRQALERWTSNRASTLSIERVENEPTGDFLDRVWRGATIPLDIRKLYNEMSELLHARGALLPIVMWEARDLAETEPPPEVLAGLAVLADLGTVVLQQVTACVMDLADHAGRPELIEPLRDWPRTTDPPGMPACERVGASLSALTPVALASQLPADLAVDADFYEEQLPSLLSQPDLPVPLLAPLAFLHRRHRALQTAVSAFEEEERLRGAPLDYQSVQVREAQYMLISESAAVVGRWTPGAAGASLLAAATALRSAFLLWLEDDNRAMTSARSVLECVAQTRTWRLKPRKAERLAERGARTTPRDWLDAAGWRRFGILNLALGELAHLTPASRWTGAIKALTVAQPQPPEFGPPASTARGSALGQVAFLLALETFHRVQVHSAPLVEPMRRVLAVGDDPDAVVTRWLDAAARFRAFGFGEPDFRPLTEEERLAHLATYRSSRT